MIKVNIIIFALILTNRLDSLTENSKKLERIFGKSRRKKNQYQNLFLVSLELDGNIYSKVTGEFKKVSRGLGTILEQGDNLVLMKEL